MPSASSWIAARTMSATLRLCPRCTTSAPCACSSRRMMLIAASWPSNSEAALTKRSGATSVLLRGSLSQRCQSPCLRSSACSRPPACCPTSLFLLLSRILPTSMIRPAPDGQSAWPPARRDRGAPMAEPRKRAARRPARRPPRIALAGAAAARATTTLKRDAVIRAAARAFNERGYHNTSLDDIAAALGVTKPTVYYYVANKEQLLFECFRAGLEPIREALHAAERSDRPARASDCALSCAVTPRDRVRIRLVHGARARAQDLGPGHGRADQRAQVRDRPGHPPPAARGRGRWLDRSVRPEASPRSRWPAR